MLRKLIVFLATVVVLAATHARALGLGDITLESALNQPLSARIELLQTTGVRMEDIRVQMAAARDFERFSLDRPYYLDSIRFNVREAGPDDERPYIELSSTSPIREPYLSFVLDTRWPRGRVLAEYTVLLDPPAFANQGAAQAPQPPVTTRFEAPEQPAGEPAPAPQAPANADQPGSQSTPASGTQGDTTASSVEVTDASSSDSGEPPAAQRFADTARTVEVDGDDTLWDVALQVRPDDGVSVQQTMLALQRLNPEAFINGNINLVRRGAVLRVPDRDDVREMGNADAISEVGRQNRLFEDRRDAPLGSEPLAAPPAEDGVDASGDGELSVVSVDDENSEDTSSASADAAAGEQLQELDDRIDSLEDQLAVSREEMDRVERENEELSDRLSMLEEQIESAREIIRLRDLELAQLQESLASNGSGQAGETGDSEQANTAPPPAVTMAPEGPLPQRIMDMVLANPMALGAILALVVALLVLLLIRRNKAKQAELADEQHEQDDDDELDFSGVGTAAAAGAAGRGDSDRDEGHDDDTEPMESGSPTSRQPFEAHDDDDELVDELRSFNEQGEQALVSEELDDLLGEVDALTGNGQYEEARKLLEDAIVADPNRQELRVRLLEVLVAQEDVEAFRLQESELGAVSNIALQHRVQALREQAAALESGGEEDSEMDADVSRDSNYFNDLDEEDDLELELDMESSAEVDDQKVVQGGDDPSAFAGSDDTEEKVDERSDDEEDFDFDLDLDLDDEESETGTEQAEREEPTGATGSGPLTEEIDSGSERAAQEASPEEGTAADEDFEFDFDLDLEPETDTETDTDTEKDPEQDARLHGDQAPEQEPGHDESDGPGADAGTGESVREEDEDFEFSLDDFALDAETDAAAAGTGEVGPDTDETAARDEEQETRNKGAEGDDAEEEDPFADLSFTDSDAEEADEAEDEFEFLSDTDEAATKLDLARAYIDMGDMEGAREILDEVMEEGTEAQASDARQLIDRLD